MGRTEYGTILVDGKTKKEIQQLRKECKLVHGSNYSGIWKTAPGGNARYGIFTCGQPGHEDCPVRLRLREGSLASGEALGWLAEASKEEHTPNSNPGVQFVFPITKAIHKRGGRVTKAHVAFAEHHIALFPNMRPRDLWKAFNKQAKAMGAKKNTDGKGYVGEYMGGSSPTHPPPPTPPPPPPPSLCD